MRQEPSKPRALSMADIEAYTQHKKQATAAARVSRIEAAQMAPDYPWDIEQLAREAAARALTYKEPPRRPIIDVVSGRPAYEPALLLSMERHIDALRLMFVGLQLHYLDCIVSGRLDAWKTAAHAVVNLCGEVGEVERVDRSKLQ